MRNVQRSTLVLALLLGACGGEPEAPATAASEPAATTPTTTASTAGSRSRSRSDDFDPNAPEYQGDHSLPGDPVAGEIVYRANCVACHDARGTGNGGMTGADFVHDRRRLSKNNETLLRSIAEGIQASPAMPAHRDILNEQQMRDALSYIRQTFGSPNPS